LGIWIQDDAPVRVIEETHGERALQLAPPCLVEDASAQASVKHVELRLAHGALQAEQQSIVEVTRIVDAVLIQDQRLRERADLQQTMPVGGVASEPRYLEPEHDAGASHTDLGDEPLESLAVAGRRSRLAEVAVDHDHALGRPTERDSALAERVLALGALLILEDLSHGRLTDIEVRISLEVTGGDLGVGFDHHERGSCKVERAIEASSVTMAVDSAGDGERSVTGSVGDAETVGGDEQDDHALIHAAIPSRRRSTSPCRSPLMECARTRARRAS
jgi:hypothetical protein